jgi:hypothetical protein
MPAEPRMLTDAEYHLVCQWYCHDGLGQEEISRRLGISKGRLFDRRLEARGKGVLADPRLANLVRRQGKGGGRRAGNDFHLSDGVVTEAEVEARRRAVFESWDDAERQARRNAGRIDDSREHRGRHAWATTPARGVVCTPHLNSQPRHRNW